MRCMHTGTASGTWEYDGFVDLRELNHRAFPAVGKCNRPRRQLRGQPISQHPVLCGQSFQKMQEPERWLKSEEHLLLIAEGLNSVPSTMWPLPITPAPGDLTYSSGFCSHLHPCAETHTDTQLKTYSWVQIPMALLCWHCWGSTIGNFLSCTDDSDWETSLVNTFIWIHESPVPQCSHTVLSGKPLKAGEGEDLGSSPDLLHSNCHLTSVMFFPCVKLEDCNWQSWRSFLEVAVDSCQDPC